jgi:modification methylase
MTRPFDAEPSPAEIAGHHARADRGVAMQSIVSEDITLYFGDCLNVMAGMQSASVDIVITSPPYNLGTTCGGGFPTGVRVGKWSGGGLENGYGAHDDSMDHKEYVEWQRRVLLECWRVIVDDGAIFYNHKPRVQNGVLWTPFELNPDLPLRQVIIWKRSGGINFSPTFYCPHHEWIMVFAKPGFRLRDKGASGVGDVWEIPQEKGIDHPAPFPVELPRRILVTTGARSALDPFAGSGSTLVACRKTGRRGIGIEINLNYCDMVRRRLKDAETPLFNGL